MYGPPPQYPPGGDPYGGGQPGIIGLVCCQFLSPVALFMGRSSMKSIDASQGRLGGRGRAQAGFVLGIIGSVLLVIGVILFAAGDLTFYGHVN